MPRPRGRSPIAAEVSSSSPVVTKRSSDPPDSSITPRAAYCASVKEAAVSTSFWSSESSESSELSAMPASNSSRRRVSLPRLSTATRLPRAHPPVHRGHGVRRRRVEAPSASASATVPSTTATSSNRRRPVSPRATRSSASYAYETGSTPETIRSARGICSRATKRPQSRICGSSTAGMNCTAWNSLVANALRNSPSATPSSALDEGESHDENRRADGLDAERAEGDQRRDGCLHGREQLRMRARTPSGGRASRAGETSSAQRPAGTLAQHRDRRDEEHHDQREETDSGTATRWNAPGSPSSTYRSSTISAAGRPGRAQACGGPVATARGRASSWQTSPACSRALRQRQEGPFESVAPARARSSPASPTRRSRPRASTASCRNGRPHPSHASRRSAWFLRRRARERSPRALAGRSGSSPTVGSSSTSTSGAPSSATASDASSAHRPTDRARASRAAPAVDGGDDGRNAPRPSTSAAKYCRFSLTVRSE